MTKEEFISKWLKFALVTVDDLGIYWSSDPRRLYWALGYEHVKGWDQVNMAEELIALYPDITRGDSAIEHARSLVCSTR